MQQSGFVGNGIGVTVSDTTAETSNATLTVTENSRNRRPVTPPMNRSGIKAAIIKVASNDPRLSGPAETVFRAAARAHRQTGVPISTHTDSQRQSGLDQQRVFAEEGVDLSRVIVGHSGDTEDTDGELIDDEVGDVQRQRERTPGAEQDVGHAEAGRHVAEGEASTGGEAAVGAQRQARHRDAHAAQRQHAAQQAHGIRGGLHLLGAEDLPAGGVAAAHDTVDPAGPCADTASEPVNGL